jgi:hypothetical protein
MIQRIAAWGELRFNIPPERTTKWLYRSAIVAAAMAFVIVATVVVVWDELYAASRSLDALRVGSVAPYNVVAPQSVQFVSHLLTEDARQQAADAVQPVYDPPDPNIARQQTQLTGQILAFIRDVREDSYASLAQRQNDLNAISALALSPEVMVALLQYSDEVWEAISSEISSTLSLVMRESIRESDLARTRAQLSNQVSVRFSEAERAVIVAIVEDLVRANTFLNEAATQQARDAARSQVTDITRSIVRGERIVREGEVITPLSYEAMDMLGLLRADVVDPLRIASGFVITLVVMVMIGLYLTVFNPLLIYRRVNMFVLLATLFLVMLIAARFLGVNGGVNGSLYAFPFAALALIFAAIIGRQEAFIATIGLGILTGYMANYSLEIAMLAAIGGVVGSLALRRTERLNAFFVAGAVVAFTNVALIAAFKLGTPDATDRSELIGILALAFVSGVVLLPATTIAVMYLVTTVFNLPTALRLIDLSQPNKPLLQRMLREAPGTYQHSLQVANLAEQAAERIQADAQLVHVAALYHDIGKMENPLFFTENQPDPTLNPHNTLKDPYRSAAIIIEHVTKGDEMARQYGLPRRIRDFILEHHGTTKVGYFYKVALEQVDNDPSLIDASAFTYPGPVPGSRETAILMLADSCEATVRSMQPRTRGEIARIVTDILESKRRENQLNQSGLTLTDLALIEATFIEILQGMYHHRIKYQEDNLPTQPLTKVETRPQPAVSTEKTETSEMPLLRRTAEIPAMRTYKLHMEIDDDRPLTEVPRLPRADEIKPNNGKPAPAPEPQEHDE